MKLKPYQYIHVLDRNTNVKRIETGPQNFIKEDHEEVITGGVPVDFISLRPYTFALITDPVVRDKDSDLVYDTHHQVKVKMGHQEIRTDVTYPDPFPLYPEEILTKISNVTIIPRNWVLKVEANRDFTLGEQKKQAGDQWLLKGPNVYVPRVEEDIIKLQEPIIIKEKIALKLKARDACDDINGVKRQAGEEWLVNTPGFYQLGVYEELVEQVEGFVITENVALRMTALKSFTDAYGKERKAGEEWLIDSSMTSVHICDVFEKVLSKIKLTVLEKSNYCYILNPVEGGQNQLGKKILVIGPRSFFLQPGEAIEGGIKEIDILSEDEALLLKASESFVDDKEEKHSAGDIWMVYGPRKYIPPVEVEVIERRDKIPLDSVEGIYIRDIKTGQVRSEIGKCYMLKPHEELWDMELSGLVENILLKEGNPPREKHKLVTYKCPFNTAVQVYNYKKKESRVSFGPNMVCLGPDEQFTVCYLSGSQPKKPGVVKTISILLGPTFSGDLVRVETSDHARLELKLSYNWIFELDKNDPASAKKIFNVRDFIGDCCSVLASRIRGVVAGVPFSRFHKHSARTIRRALFGEDESGHIGKRFYFETNNLLVSNVDIQRVEPVVQKTKEMLQRSVTQAINITTQIQEQEARRHAEKMEQDAKGVLERQILSDNSIVEEARKALLGLQAESDSIKSSGQAVAEAKARAEAAEISAEAEVNLADLRSQANSCKETTIIEFINKKHEAEIAHEKKMNNLKITKAKELSEIESLKFQSIMGTIGQDTLVQISLAGPEMKAKLLEGLGLKGFMMMDSKNPVNLFQAASGMMGPNIMQTRAMQEDE